MAKQNERSNSATSGPTPLSEERPSVARVEIPLADAGVQGYCQRHIEVQLTGNRPAALRRMVEGLAMSGERVDGRLVSSGPDAIRWMLDRISNGQA